METPAQGNVLLERFDEVPDEVIKEAASLFSENYGIWGPLAETKLGPFAKAGRPKQFTSV
jgi:hypothetical protein